MNLPKIKVYHLFWMVSLLILLSHNPEGTMDINIHDTYYVIPHLYGTTVLFLSYFLMGVGYWLVQKILKKQLIKPLTIIHSSIFIGSFILFWMVILYTKIVANNNFPLDDHHAIVNIILIVEFLLMLIIALPLYTTNLLLALLKRKETINQHV